MKELELVWKKDLGGEEGVDNSLQITEGGGWRLCKGWRWPFLWPQEPDSTRSRTAAQEILG